MRTNLQRASSVVEDIARSLVEDFKFANLKEAQEVLDYLKQKVAAMDTEDFFDE